MKNMEATKTIPALTQYVESFTYSTEEDREAILKKLLPYDYEDARSQGLIDMFHYDPEANQDGLLHTLIGNHNSLRQAEGFHHELSASMVAPYVQIESDDGLRVVPVTRVDRSATDKCKAKVREYAERPWEPSRARVVINGLKKMSLAQDKAGKSTLKAVHNSMYPNEYDTFAVLQNIKRGYDTLMSTVNSLAPSRGMLIGEANVPLVDGVSEMTILYVIHPESHKIVSAIPRVPRKPILGLDEEGSRRMERRLQKSDQSTGELVEYFA